MVAGCVGHRRCGVGGWRVVLVGPRAPPSFCTSLLLAHVLGCASERRAAVVFLRLVALFRACFVLHGTAAATYGLLLWCGCRTFIASARFFTARALFPCVSPPSAAIALCSFQAFQRSEAHPVEASAAILPAFFPGRLAAVSQGLAGRGRGGAKRRNFGVFVGSLSQGFLLMRLLCSATRAPPSAGDEPEDRLVLLVAFHALLLARDIRRSDVVSRPQLVLPVRCISAAHARGGRLETHLLLCRRTL